MIPTTEIFKEMLPGLSFSESEQQHLLSFLQCKKIPEGEHILRAGKICRFISYTCKGLFMYYSIHDGDIKPMDFGIEKDWVAEMESFSSQTVSDISIIALEDSIVYSIDYQDLERLFELYPQLIHVQMQDIQKALTQATQHAYNLAVLPAQERYAKLLERHPEWVQRIPQYHLAAYLGIRPQSLSRIRKNSAKKLK